MGALDQIRQMRQEGFSEQDISDSLQEQGISPNSITDAFSQARIKDVVEGENEMQENDFPETPSPFSTPETYAPQEMPQDQYYSPQESPYLQPQETESYSPQEGYTGDQGGFGTDTIIEIAEQVFEEKIKKRIDLMERNTSQSNNSNSALAWLYLYRVIWISYCKKFDLSYENGNRHKI